MAYMNQERKKVIAAKLKAALAGTGVKYSLSVRNHSTLVMTITSVPEKYNFFRDAVQCHSLLGPGSVVVNNYRDELERNGYVGVNTYWYHEHFTGNVKELLAMIIPIMNDGNHDRSDIQTDYFDVGWYIDITAGTYDKPLKVVK